MRAEAKGRSKTCQIDQSFVACVAEKRESLRVSVAEMQSGRKARGTVMPQYGESELLTIREAFSAMTVDELKPLALLVAHQVPMRKGELVDLLVKAMQDAEKVRGLYAGLGDVSQKAI